MTVKSFFPTLIYEAPLIKNSAKLKKFLKEIHKDCLRIAASDTAGKEWSESSYTNGYTSYSSISNLLEHSSHFVELREHLDEHVKSYTKKLGLVLEQKPQITSSWMNIMPATAAHSLHLHPNSIISGTFYVETPKGSGVIKFEDPRLSKMMLAPLRKDAFASGSFARYDPKPGHVILFESWLRHEVEVNRSAKERISVSFNYL